jgi:predicted lipase
LSSIPYDCSRTALFSPERNLSTVFVTGAQYSWDQVGVEAARLAYLKGETQGHDRQVLRDAFGHLSFEAPTSFSDAATGSQGFGAFRVTDKVALLAFRGTQPDEVTDIEADLIATLSPWTEAGGRVHSGFASRWRALRKSIDSWLNTQCADRKKLIVCGHSLGAALATLSATVWGPATLITIGSPRVGDADFAKVLGPVAARRFVNCCDIVTQVPPDVVSPYVHVGPETYVDRTGQVRGDPPSDVVEADRTKARAVYLLEEAWKVGAVVVRDLADHSPINYVRAVFA